MEANGNSRGGVRPGSAAADTAPGLDEPAIRTQQDLYDGPDGSTLPEDLRSAEREDTVCRYCGVSYLVFSEVKALERRTLAAEKAMELWKDKIARVSELEEELGRVRTGLQDAWSAHSEAVRGSAREAGEHALVVRTLQEQLRAANLGAEAKATASVGSLRRVATSCATALPALRSHCDAVRRELLECTADVLALNQAAARELDSALSLVGDLGRDKMALSTDVQTLSDKLAALKPLKSEVETLRRQLRSEQDCNRNLRDQVDDCRTRCEQQAASLNAALQKAAAKAADAEFMGQSAQSSAAEAIHHAFETRKGILSHDGRLSECAYDAQIAALLEVRSDLERSLRANEQQLQESLTAHDSTRHRLEDALSSLSALQDHVAAVEEQRSVRERDLLQQLQQLSHQHEAHLDSCGRQMASLEGDLRSCQQHVKALVDREHTAAGQHAAELGAVTEQAQAMIRSQTGSIEQLDAQLMAVRQELREARQEAKHSVEQWARERAGLQAELATAQQQASVGTSAILEASALREEVRRERTRADVAMQQAEEAMRAHSSTAHRTASSDSKLLEVMARLSQREKDVEMLQATVHQECAERTVILEQLNQLRREVSLPPLPAADLHRLAAEYMAKTGGAPSSVPHGPGSTGPGSSAGSGQGGHHPPRRGSSAGSGRSLLGLASPSSSGAAAGSDGVGCGSSGTDGSVSLPPLPRSRGSSQPHLVPQGDHGSGDAGGGDGVVDGVSDADTEAASAWLSSGKSRGAGRGRGRGRGR